MESTLYKNSPKLYYTGDSPYPGLNAEQTVYLLERGYRMQRPIHISAELWVIYYNSNLKTWYPLIPFESGYCGRQSIDY